MPLLAQELNLTISMRVPDRKMTNKIIAVTGQRAGKIVLSGGQVRRNHEATVQETGMAMIVLLLCTSAALAQFSSSIEGSVTDSTGAIVPGAKLS